MNIALVHELLTIRGGAENVLGIFADMFPEAPIYTLLYDEEVFGKRFPASRVRPSTLQKRAGLSTNHHLYLRSFPKAVEAWDFSEFDLVISSSSAFAHGIITNGKPKHLSYIHSPARYLWDRTHDVLDRSEKGLIGTLRHRWLEKTFHKLRVWDTEAADRADMLIAASKTVQRRIELYWRRKSDVIYPPINDAWFAQAPRQDTGNEEPFLIISTLARYKRIDLAIEACNRIGARLIIAGEGRDRARLEKLAGPTVSFAGYMEGRDLRELCRNARGVIFPGEEDFGLVPIEAMACGTPVIALKAGGALETIEEGVTGTFFDQSSSDDLARVLGSFDPSRFDASVLRASAERFRRQTFEERIRRTVDALMAK